MKLDSHIMRSNFHNMERSDFSPMSSKSSARREQSIAKTVKGSQSVYRAIAVLRGVARHHRTGITSTELCEELNLTPATTHRLLQVLLSENILTVDPYSKKYHLGLELYLLGSAAHDFAVREHLAVHLENLRKLSRETVFLFVRSGADSLCLRRIDGDCVVAGLTIAEGSRRPLGVGAGGLALLAAESNWLVERILRSNASLYGNYFDVPLKEIWRWVEATRKRGFAFNDGRLKTGVRAVGIAVGPPSERPLAAVSIATDDTRMTAAMRSEFERLLRVQFKKQDKSLLNLDDKLYGGLR